MRLGRFGAKPEPTRVLLDLCRELHALDPAVRREALLTLSPETLSAIEALSYEWYLFARPEQVAPTGDWRWWVMCGGRGGGKTRPGAEETIERADTCPGIRIAMVARDAGGIRKTMLRGESGILRRSPPWFQPKWYKTDKLLVWPNDTTADLHSSEEPGTLRGPQYHFAWVTELFHWGIPRREKEPIAWREGIKLALRLGDNPQGIIDSSPRATEFCANFLLGPKDRAGKRLVSQAQIDSGDWAISHEVADEDGKTHTYRVVVRRWSSERNAENLGPGVIAEWRHDFRGSRLEEQELDGKILMKVEGALWSLEAIEADCVDGVPTIVKTRVAVDPTRSEAPRDEAGILVGGRGADGHVYVWDDCSLRGSPRAWGERAIAAKNRYGADALVIEANRLEKATKETVRTIDPSCKWIEVHATDGKRTRAEPVSALSEAHKVHFVRDPRDPDKFALLWDEMISWDPRARMASPNRMDALVWLIWDLMGLDETVKKPIRIL